MTDQDKTALRAPVADERATLQKLVDLEDMRLRLRALHESGHGTDYDYYHKALPAAWEAARAALASPPVADRQRLRELVDVVWNEATESTAVPDTQWADRLIDKVFPAGSASAPVAGEATSVIPGRVHDIMRAGATIVLHMESAEAAQHAYNAIEGAHRVAVNIEQSVSPVAGEAVAYRVGTDLFSPEALPAAERYAEIRKKPLEPLYAAPQASEAVPVAWAIFSPSGNIRYWHHDKSNVDAFAAKHGLTVCGLANAGPTSKDAEQIADLVLGHAEGLRVSSLLESGTGFGKDVEHRFQVSNGEDRYGVVIILTALSAQPGAQKTGGSDAN